LIHSRQLYAMKEDGSSGMLPVTGEQAHALNSDLYGIFWSVNKFDGPRQIKNLQEILSWFVELDGETKEEQWTKIESSPLIPSLVVESFRGFHVYFDALDAAPENYRSIEERLIHHFSGDPKAKDLARVLRAPGYLHQKRADNPFQVTVKFESEFRYSEGMMEHFFEAPPQAEPISLPSPSQLASSSGDSLTARIDSLNCEQALRQLSGHWSVNYERYDFKAVGRGRKNILVNGKGTSCFIDERGRIGATPGGPTIFTWLRYFGHDDKTIFDIIEKEFGNGKVP
jgi:hypothetical protein